MQDRWWKWLNCVKHEQNLTIRSPAALQKCTHVNFFTICHWNAWAPLKCSFSLFLVVVPWTRLPSWPRLFPLKIENGFLEEQGRDWSRTDSQTYRSWRICNERNWSIIYASKVSYSKETLRTSKVIPIHLRYFCVALFGSTNYGCGHWNFFGKPRCWLVH